MKGIFIVNKLICWLDYLFILEAGVVDLFLGFNDYNTAEQYFKTNTLTIQ